MEIEKVADELRSLLEENRSLRNENEELARIRELQAKEIFERDSFIEQVKSKLASLETENHKLYHEVDHLRFGSLNIIFNFVNIHLCKSVGFENKFQHKKVSIIAL